jgi:hypothetical protein
MSELVVLDSEPPSNESLVGMLEEALEQAKAGKLSSAALAKVWRDGTSGTAWSTPANISTLLGTVTRLQFRMAASVETHEEQ